MNGGLVVNSVDKGKLKALIKMILINEYPRKLTANQINTIINKYDWGFRRNVSSAIIGKLLNYELNKHNNNFMNNVAYEKKGGVNVYYMETLNEK